jgi:hypothetical protein
MNNRDNRDIGRDVTPCHSPLSTVTNVTPPLWGVTVSRQGRDRDIGGDVTFAAMRNAARQTQAAH